MFMQLRAGFKIRAALFEVHAQPGVAEPHDLAGSRRLGRQDELERCRDADGGLNLETRAGFRKVAHRAWHGVAAEKNLPGFERPHALYISVFVHGCHRE
jgi:hypothetical protein